MPYKVSLKLKSPLMIGGKKVSKNYSKSLPYIPGGVFRAAISKEILKRCTFFDYTKDKKFKIKHHGEEECQDCPVKDLCKNFEDLRFTALYPFGGKPYPVTNLRCKYNSSHKNVDTLIYSIKSELNQDVKCQRTCPEKDCNERLEKKEGLYFEGKDLEPVYNLITKNGVDPFTRKAKDSFLYSLDTLTDKMYIDGDKKDLEFTGEIYAEAEEDIFSAIQEISVGAYNTAGFGRCAMEVSKLTSKDDLTQRVDKFNSLINYDETVISLTLNTDSYLGLEQAFTDDKSPAEVKLEEYKEIYSKLFSEVLGPNYSLMKVMVNHELRRGFDTTTRDAKLRKAKIITKAGGVFVFTTKENNYDKLKEIELKGIGINTEFGFGQVSVCDNCHIDFSMIREG